MANTAEQQVKTMLANLPEKTGKPLATWLKLVKAEGLEKHGQILKFLKGEHGLTHGYANFIAHQFLSPPASGDALIDAQYAGAKAELRPILDKVLAAVAKFGKDVEVAPKKTAVSLRRSKQFALVQPSTKTRVDIGINLKGAAPTERLEASGSFSAMVSHRVRLSSPKDVDKELLSWLRAAYDKA